MLSTLAVPGFARASVRQSIHRVTDGKVLSRRSESDATLLTRTMGKIDVDRVLSGSRGGPGKRVHLKGVDAWKGRNHATVHHHPGIIRTSKADGDRVSRIRPYPGRPAGREI